MYCAVTVFVSAKHIISAVTYILIRIIAHKRIAPGATFCGCCAPDHGTQASLVMKICVFANIVVHSPLEKVPDLPEQRFFCAIIAFRIAMPFVMPSITSSQVGTDSCKVGSSEQTPLLNTQGHPGRAGGSRRLFRADGSAEEPARAETGHGRCHRSGDTGA